MSSPRDVLTPDSLAMLQVIATTGSFAAAARQLGLVPSALTYRVRQMEEALDVLLFDRRSRQAQPTEAGQALLAEGQRLLLDIDAVAHRVRRVATGWEPELTLAADGVIARETLFDLIEAFDTLGSPTKLKLVSGILAGTLEALTSGRADLAIGLSAPANGIAGLQVRDLGDLRFTFAVAPFHPLARAEDPITDEMLLEHRLVVVADSAAREPMSIGLLNGQSTITVDTLQAKLDAQVRGLGCGFVPAPMLQPYLQAGLLVEKDVARPTRHLRMRYAWVPPPHGELGRALQWWLTQLDNPTTQRALLERHRLPHHATSWGVLHTAPLTSPNHAVAMAQPHSAAPMPSTGTLAAPTTTAHLVAPATGAAAAAPTAPTEAGATDTATATVEMATPPPVSAKKPRKSANLPPA